MYFLTYLLAPKYCHSFVGYLEVGIGGGVDQDNPKEGLLHLQWWPATWCCKCIARAPDWSRTIPCAQEEAVKTYTRAIEDLDAGKLPEWSALPASIPML